MSREAWYVNKWSQWEKWAGYSYSSSDPVVLIIELERTKPWIDGTVSAHFAERLRWLSVLSYRREEFTLFPECRYR